MGIYTLAVQKLYVAYFSRPADVPGLEYWEHVIAAANGSTAAVVQAFAASAEYKAEYAGKDSIGIINTIYMNLFGRQAEVAALAFWAGGLERKSFTIGDAVTTIAGAAQGSDRTAYNNKITAATAFTAELDTTTEILGYTGANANSALKKFIAGVTDDASLARAIDPVGLKAFVRFVVFGEPVPPLAPQVIAYDVTLLNKTFDADQLVSANKVIEFVAKGSVGDATLINVGAGASFRATADMGASTLTLTHKVPGELSITVDADEIAVADIGPDVVVVRVNATNASALKLVFDTAFRPAIDGESAAGDNAVTLRVSGAAAAAEVVSGGVAANNSLDYTDTSAALAGLKISGGNALVLTTAGTSALATVDASALTAGLTVSTSVLADGGLIRLGSGADRVTVASTSTEAGTESIAGFTKAGPAALSSDTDLAAAAIALADLLSFDGAVTVANANTSVAGATIVNGVLGFTGAGPGYLGEAVAIAQQVAETAGEAVLFEYIGRSYIFVQGSDQLVQLVGITGVARLVEAGSSDTLFIV